MPEWYSIAKTVLDLSLCLAILPLAAVLVAVISIAILIDSGWPVLLSQERVGRNGRPFRILKFRTLRKDYDVSRGKEFMRAFVTGRLASPIDGVGTQVFKPISDLDVTRVGRVLRQTSLDELPQLFNVLRREMSVVGPRPNVPWEVEVYADWHRERLKAMPGITGLAQVRGRSCLAFDDIVRYDITYVQAQSLRLDLEILKLTVMSVMRRRGAL